MVICRADIPHIEGARAQGRSCFWGVEMVALVTGWTNGIRLKSWGSQIHGKLIPLDVLLVFSSCLMNPDIV